MYFEPSDTKKTVATYHVTLFGCGMGGDEGDFQLSFEVERPCMIVLNINV
jgi:hypothetical protein